MADSTALKTTEEELRERTGGTPEGSVAQKVRGWFSTAKSARINKDQKLLDQYRIYRFSGDAAQFPWRSDIYIPMGNVNVEVKTAKMLTAILASDPFFRAKARSMRFMQNEEAVQQLMIQQLEEMGWPKVLHGWIKTHYIFSTSVLKGYWKYEEVIEEVEETVMQPVYVRIGDGPDGLMQVGEEPVTKTVKRPRVVFDGPCFEVCNIFDVYWDPHATSLKNARYVIHRKDVTVDYLQAKADQGIYSKSAVNAIKAARAESSASDSGEKIAQDNIDGEEVKDSVSPTVEILECTTLTRLIVIGPGDVSLRDDPMKYSRINFFELSHLPDPHRLFGTAVNEPVEKIQKAINKTLRLHLDEWDIHVHKMLLVSEDAVKNPGDLVARPGGYVRIKAGRDLDNSVKELSRQPHGMESNAIMDMFERMNEVVTGVTEPAKGIERRSGKGETATKTRMSAAGASVRFGVELILIEPAIKEVLEFMHSMNQTFLTVPRIIRVMGEQGRTYPLIGADHVEGEFDFKFELAPVQGNKEVWLQRLMLVFQQFSQNPLLAPMTDWVEMGKRLLKAADVRTPELILNPQNMQQNMMLMMMQQQGPQAGAGNGETGPATNSEAGALSAQRRMPQPTARDANREVGAGVG